MMARDEKFQAAKRKAEEANRKKEAEEKDLERRADRRHGGKKLTRSEIKRIKRW